jgi:drug/metabolite transporter (DMT)-like permease
MSKQIKPHLALILANVLYGVNYVVAKGVMPTYITPYALTLLRILPATILFWIVGFWVKQEITQKKDYLNLFFAGLLGVFLNQFMFISGLNLSTPINAAIMMTTNPILVMVVSAIVLKDKISVLKIFGIILGATGAVILIAGKGFTGFNQEHLSGDLLLLGNSVSFALYMAFARPLMQKYDAFVVLKWMFLFGAIMYFPIGITPLLKTNWSLIPFQGILSLIYIVIGTTFLTYLLINYALKHLKSTTVSIYIYTQPVVAGVTASLTGADKLTVMNISASVLVFVGVYLVSRVNKREIAK